MSIAMNNSSTDRPVFLSPKETSSMLGVAASTLANWRSLGNPCGPPFVKVGGLVRYPLGSLLSWVDSRTGTKHQTRP